MIIINTSEEVIRIRCEEGSRFLFEPGVGQEVPDEVAEEVLAISPESLKKGTKKDLPEGEEETSEVEEAPEEEETPPEKPKAKAKKK